MNTSKQECHCGQLRPKHEHIHCDHALKALERMSDEEFNTFLWSLPVHVQLLVRANMADWRRVLPAWYLKKQQASEPITASDLPF